ncbi:MAG: aminopeptidase P N-terminal domain-containing protein [Planctomycetota bacterium]
MPTSRKAPLALLFVLATANSQPLFAQKPEEFRARRAALLQSLHPESLLVLRGADPSARSMDGRFRQHGNFFYLTGVTAPGGVLVLRTVAAPEEQEFLYTSSQDAEAVSGVGNIQPERQFDGGDFEKFLRSGIKTVYLSSSGSSRRRFRRRAEPSADELLVKKVQADGVEVKVEDSPGSVINAMRAVKSPSEIELLRAAIDITCSAQKEAMRSAVPGIYEYQLQEIIEHVFRMNGSSRTGFPSICGSGPNSCEPHWMKNDRETEEGDLSG